VFSSYLEFPTIEEVYKPRDSEWNQMPKSRVPFPTLKFMVLSLCENYGFVEKYASVQLSVLLCIKPVLFVHVVKVHGSINLNLSDNCPAVQAEGSWLMGNLKLLANSTKP
jgi:hypothetical protein